MIIALKHTIDVVLKKNELGKITVMEFNSALSEIVSNIQSSLFPGFRKLNYRKMRFQATPNYGDEASFLEQAMEYYVTEKEVLSVDSKVDIKESFDDELFLIKDVATSQVSAEKLKLTEFNTISKSKKFKPSDCSPIYTMNNGILKIAPEPKNKKLEVVYFRKVKAPKLTYNIVQGQEVYNPDAQDFQDIDVHPIMHHAVFIELLLYFGLNLKEEYAIQMAQQMKQEEQMKQQ